MSLRFMDGFDHYTSTADMILKWTSSSGITNATTRFSYGRSAAFTGSSATKTVDQQPKWTVGAAIKINALPSSATLLFGLSDGGTLQNGCYLNPDATLSIRNGAGTVLATASGTPFGTGTWYYIEYQCSSFSGSAAAGACVISYTGFTIASSAASAVTKSTANTTANQLVVGSPGISCLVDDLYLCDGQGSSNTTFLGEIRIETLFPTGAGSNTAWTPITGANYACVNQNPEDGDTTYVSTSTPVAKDSYAMADLSSTPTTVFGMQTVATCRKDDAGAHSAASIIRSGGTDYAATTTTLPSAYTCMLDVWEQNPDGSGVWTGASVNAMEVGVTLVS